MYHIFFILSSVEGHLGCLQGLAIMNNAAENTVEQMSLWYDYPLGICPRVLSLDLEVDRFPIFWETAVLISNVATNHTLLIISHHFLPVTRQTSDIVKGFCHTDLAEDPCLLAKSTFHVLLKIQEISPMGLSEGDVLPMLPTVHRPLSSICHRLCWHCCQVHWVSWFPLDSSSVPCVFYGTTSGSLRDHPVMTIAPGGHHYLYQAPNLLSYRLLLGATAPKTQPNFRQ